MQILKIIEHALHPWQELDAFEKALNAQGKYGATSIFVGTMRDFNVHNNIESMTLEHYPNMTEKEMQKILDACTSQWSLNGSMIIHRVGQLKPGDPIVLTAAYSAHREDAFAACRFMVETLKSSVPLWKKEISDKNEYWV